MAMFKKIIFIIILFISCNKTKMQNQSLTINKISIKDTPDFENISNALEKNTSLIKIDHLQWNDFPYKPKVSFRIAHSDSLLFLKYYVKEEHILATQTESNSAVHKDSCVEFFIDPTNNGNYYNFEFNCIGTTHLSFGAGRYNRVKIPIQIIDDEIKVWSTLGNKPFEEKSGDFQWQMVIAIPSTVFIFNKGLNFSKLFSRANFYKCGDNTNKKHYLTWNPVKTKNPDFHRPEYFGLLNFK